MKGALIQSLHQALASDPKAYFLTGDLGYDAFEALFSEFPERALNVGVAEANMIGVASGLSRAGHTVFCYSMIPFVLMRALEQIRVQLGIGKQDIKVVGVGAGFTYGVQGSSHHAIEDIGIARSIPELEFFHPGTAGEVRAAIAMAASSGRPTYIRIGWPTDRFEYFDRDRGPLESVMRIREGGSKVCLISTGAMLGSAVLAQARLKAELDLDASLLHVPILNPFDDERFFSLLGGTETLVSIENNVAAGGLGEMLALKILKAGARLRFLSICLPAKFDHLARSKAAYEEFAGVSAERIFHRVRDSIATH